MATETESHLRAETLSLKRVPAGLATLAVVKKVDASHVYLNLPYGLTAVSKSADVNPAAALLASGHVAESASDSDSDSELPTETTLRGMQKLFSAGQYVSCVVLRNESEGKGKAGGQKSILHVSLHPAVVNSELTFDHLSKKNPTVWGAITSKEDHGFVVDVGVAGVHAFLPFSNVVGGPSSLLPGSCGFFSVSAQKKGASSVVLAYDPSQTGKVTKSDGVLSLASLKPGMLVDATVKKVLRNGILLSFLEFFQGSVDFWHLPSPASAYWVAEYEKGKRVQARILFINLSAKIVGLSCAPHVISLDSATFEVKHGDVIDPATIVRVDGGGVMLSFANPEESDDSKPLSKDAKAQQVKALCQWGKMAFCTASKLSDSRVEHIERTFSVGASVQCRAIGTLPMERMVTVSLQPSVLKAAVLSYDELFAGQVLPGTVSTVAEYGVLVTLGQGIRGIVSPHHITDAATASSKNKVKVGAVVKVRVLDVEARKRKCSLTIKRSLVESTLPAITSYDVAAAGAPTLISHGFVTAIRPGKGIIVTFYNNVFGFVSEKELEKAGFGSAESCEHMIGTVVKARVVAVDVDKRRLQLSLRLSTVGLTGAVGSDPEGTSVALGTLTNGSIVALEPGTPAFARAIIRVAGADGKTICHGTLSLRECGDTISEASAAFEALKASQKLSNLVILDRVEPTSNDGYPLILSLRPLLVAAAQKGPEIVAPSFDTVHPGQFLAGHVSAVKDFGVFVQFGRRFSALVPKSLLSDELVTDPHACVNAVVGNSVWVKVQSVDAASNRVLLNMKPSVVSDVGGKKKDKHPKAASSGTAADSEGGREAAPKSSGRKSAAGMPASTLAVGATVQAKVEVHAGSGDCEHMESLAVTLVGVTGRYKARLSLAECCDICPFTGTILNGEGLDTFKRLRESSSSGSGSPVFRAKVVSIHQGKSKKQSDVEKATDGMVSVELTIRPSELKLPEGQVSFPRWLLSSKPGSISSPLTDGQSTRAIHCSQVGCTRGAWSWGVVESVSDNEITVGFGAGLRGTMFVLEADRGLSLSSHDQIAVLNDVTHGRRYGPGQPMLCVVTDVNVANKQLLLSGYRAHAAIAAAGAVLPKKIAAVTTENVTAALKASRSAVKPESLQPGSVCFGVVVPGKSNRSRQTIGDHVSGLTLHVQVDSRVFVAVPVTHIADPVSWCDRPLEKFSIGQVVQGVMLPPGKQRVESPADAEDVDMTVNGGAGEPGEPGESSADNPKKRKTAMPRAAGDRKEMSLRPALIKLANAAPDKATAVAAIVAELQAEEQVMLSVGNVVTGFVEGSTKKGCFVYLCQGWRARSLLKDLSDGFVKNVAKAFPTGKLVAGRVLAVNVEKRMVDLSLKGSAVTGVKTLVGETATGDASDDDSNNMPDSETELVGVPARKLSVADASDEDNSDNSEGDSGSEISSQDEATAVAQQKPSKRRRFDWDADSGETESKDDEAGDVWEDGHTEGDGNAHTGRRARTTAKKRLDTEVDRQEKRLASDDFVPENQLDFERLVLASPNSSLIWIRYMAYQLSLTEVDAARAVAERALKTISFRDEQEKLNVWVAFLNLEHNYGDSASVTALFARALQHNNPKKIYGHMLSMYEARDRFDEANTLYQVAVKKYSSSKKFWMNWGSMLMKSGKPDASRSTLTRALTVLPRRKHVAVIQKHGILEYKSGFPERGRTIFEGLLSSEPKRSDLWSVYIDQEIASGDVEHARRLFERAVHVKQSTKKVKFLFKKFLAFEMERGTPETVEHVRNAARAYVESLAT